MKLPVRASMSRSPLYRRGGFLLLVAMVVAFLETGCASYEKSVTLGYERGGMSRGGAGEIYVANPVFDRRLPRLPGAKVLLGTVTGSGTQIVTSDDAKRWMQGAMLTELFSAGFEVRTVPSISTQTKRGLSIRIERLSSNQESDGIILTTITDIAIAVDIWKDGLRIKTLTASATHQDQGLDRSGDVVASSLQSTLQSVLDQIVPGVIDTLNR
jgi:hypothetical protein